MEVNGGVRRRVSREGSPEKGRSSSSRVMRAPPPLSFRRVQVVYYLSRNGHLEHPHFMEISHLPSHQLRLKDVMDRLTALRGRGMPSLYSWSCKRCYKNGYVWNDLSENDPIYPANGVEYVLKGSEIIHGSTSDERFQQLQLSHRISKPTKHQLGVEEYEYMEDDDEEIEEDERGNLTASNRTANNGGGTRYQPPFSRCSRGVSTEELMEAPAGGGGNRSKHHTELPLDDASPPSSSSSDKAAPSGSARPVEDGSDSPGSTRNSVLLQLISCGGAAAARAGGGGGGRAGSVHVRCAGMGGGGGGGGRKSGGLHRGVLSRLATRASEVEGELEEGELRCLSENPRFGNPQAEEKEYFSGSIVESMAESGRVAAEPTLKKSSSYNEERSSKAGIGEVRLLEVEVEEEERGGGGGVKGKCIPGRKRSCSKQQPKK